MQEYIQIELDKKLSNIYFRNGRWLLHVLMFLLITIAMLSDDSIEGTMTAKLVYVVSTYIGLFGLGFYCYCRYLIPVYFKRNRQALFWLYLALSLLTLPLIILIVQTLTSQYAPDGYTTSLTFQSYWEEFRDTLIGFIALSFMPYLIEVAEGRKTYKAIREELIRSHTIEQHLIRTKMDPVFVMRSLEGIAQLSMAHERQAPEAVIAFSDVLRYRLYQKRPEGLLSEELQYLGYLCQFQNSISTRTSACTLQIMGEAGNQYMPSLLLINIAELALKTDNGSPGWSVFFYILIEATEVYVIIELPASVTEAAATFDQIIALAGSMLGEDCTFTKESGEDSVSLNICIPIRKSAA